MIATSPTTVDWWMLIGILILLGILNFVLSQSKHEIYQIIRG